MDAIKYLKEKNRMCGHEQNYENGCSKCELSFFCQDCSTEKAEKAVAIVEKWSNENPIQTYLSYALKYFPNMQIDSSGSPDACRDELFGTETSYICDHFHACEKCWNEPYREG